MHGLLRTRSGVVSFLRSLGGLLVQVLQFVQHAVNLIARSHDGRFFGFESLDDLMSLIARMVRLDYGLMRELGKLSSVLMFLFRLSAGLRGVLMFLFGLGTGLRGVLMLLLRVGTGLCSVLMLLLRVDTGLRSVLMFLFGMSTGLRGMLHVLLAKVPRMSGMSGMAGTNLGCLVGSVRGTGCMLGGMVRSVCGTCGEVSSFACGTRCATCVLSRMAGLLRGGGGVLVCLIGLLCCTSHVLRGTGGLLGG
jgi:hypothetical protein